MWLQPRKTLRQRQRCHNNKQVSKGRINPGDEEKDTVIVTARLLGPPAVPGIQLVFKNKVHKYSIDFIKLFFLEEDTFF